MTSLRVPVTTYRLQFNRGFRFMDAQALVPYLHTLGVTDLYASPLFRARRGSTHGYDVTDPTCLNPELGTGEEFESLVKELKHHGMGLLLDIVPNHMAASSENPWWMDVLENGPSSRYAAFFDIDWHPGGGALSDKILLPILGAPYGSVLENQELVLGIDEDGLYVRYYETRLPLSPKSYPSLLAHRIRTFEGDLGKTHPAFRALLDLIDAIQKLPGGATGEPEKRHQRKESLKRSLWELYLSHPEIKTLLDENIRFYNGTKGDPKSFDLLDRLLDDQAYRLGFWRGARERINYRRFFDISDLVSVRVEESRVFEATHSLILECVRVGKVTGLRADHVDGLFDPVGYCDMLQSRITPSSNFYLLVEKILVGDETLPEEWPVAGTTGYEFANAVNGVFVDLEGIRRLDTMYASFTGTTAAFPDVVYQQKKRVIEDLFMGEMRTLGRYVELLAEEDRYARDVTFQERLQAVAEVTACLPVYRTYIRSFDVPSQDRLYIERAMEMARRRNPALGTPIFDFLRRVLLLDFPPSLTAKQKEAWLYFVRRWQQFTGPIMAKGLEDTSLYIYNRLVSLNEVGGDPGAQRVSLETFHRQNAAVRTHWPTTLNATSTHDTKRSEDVRARINVLSELPEAWAKCLGRWGRWNRVNKRRIDGQPVPDPNEEFLLYQALLGAWPLHKEEVSAFKERLKGYVIKAAKEAKVHTSWIDPNPEYEGALVAFVDAILRASKQNKFLADFVRFQKKIAFYGAFNALAQVLLKITAPGVPDFYQGTELWDLSLVDPDNRRPVDFKKRVRMLEDLKRRETGGVLPLAAELLARWEDGRMKLFVTSKALDFRRIQRHLFLGGDYVPLYPSGKRKEHLCAFARHNEGAWVLVAVPRLLTRLVTDGTLPLGERVWGTDRLVLPTEAPDRWQNVLTDEILRASFVMGRKVLPLKSLFRNFPVVMLSGFSA